MNHLPIVITPGEPAGIGPDLVLQLAQTVLPRPWVVVADADLLRQRAQQLQLPIVLTEFDPAHPGKLAQAGELVVVHEPLKVACVAQQPNKANAEYVINTLEHAVAGCLAQQFAALVTGPVHKGLIQEAGIVFPGHTEWLAQRTQTKQVVMLLVAGTLRVALVTTHLPLAKVSQAITPGHLDKVIRVLYQGLTNLFKLAQPNIYVCGLNPHAGEGGHIGREEVEIIAPVLANLRAEGMQLIGPLSADTVFTPQHLTQADVVLAMYHDQGLPVLKYCGFGQAVNITLGLPIVRTSVDHGTAYDLAGTGKANIGSLKAAIQLALN